LKTSQQSFLSYSSNGTFVNQQKLQRNGVEVEVQHGDIVSLVGPLEHGEFLSSNHASAIPSFGFFLYHG
jgi:pSer/pThr/pTyr-binding forkhead associated (FHA) protein